MHGLGFSGPSGFLPLTSPDRLYNRESYLASAVVAENDTLLAYALDHRRFLQQTSFHNRTSRRGLVNRHLESETVFCEVALLTENTPGGSEVVLPTLRFRWSPSLATGLDHAAADIASGMDVQLNKPARWHYCSWYRRHSHYSLADLRAFLAQHAASGLHLQAAQIDDGYQTAPGDWLSPNERWPGGLHTAFNEIRRHGLTPGIWVAPFMVGNRSQLYRNHPDWVVRTRDGQPWTEWRHYDGTHAHEEHYCLDASHPAVVEHLHHTFRQLRDWGAGLFKTDFLDWGLKDTTHALRHNPHLTTVEAYRNVMAAIRDAIGPDSYWLGCIAPYAPMLGFADGIRIANDVGTHWSDGSHGNLLAESQHTYWFHRVLFENDPDALYLRQVFNQLSDRDMRAVAYWVGVLALSVNSSEFPDEVSPSRMALWKWLRPEAHPPKGTVTVVGQATRPARGDPQLSAITRRFCHRGPQPPQGSDTRRHPRRRMDHRQALHAVQLDRNRHHTAGCSGNVPRGTFAPRSPRPLRLARRLAPHNGTHPRRIHRLQLNSP